MGRDNKVWTQKPYMVVVRSNNRESLDNALKQLKLLLKDARVKDTYISHCEFKRKGQKRREKKLRAISRYKHALEREAA